MFIYMPERDSPPKTDLGGIFLIMEFQASKQQGNEMPLLEPHSLRILLQQPDLKPLSASGPVTLWSLHMTCSWLSDACCSL